MSQALVEQALNVIGEPTDLRASLASVYRRTAAELELFDWIQGDSGRGANRERCAGNAVFDVALRTVHHNRFLLQPPCAEQPFVISTSFCALAVNALGAWLGMPVAVWNDAPERTKEEVVKTLRALADYLTTPQEVHLG